LSNIKDIKGSFDNGLQILKLIYNTETVEDSIYELWNVYTLCSLTEDWVAIVELKWDFNLTDVEAVKFWNILEILNSRKYL